MQTTPVTAKPWFREPWPWLLMLGPALSVIGGVAMFSLALRSDDGLVVDDYYKQGMAINKTLARDEQAKSGRYRAVMRWGAGELSVSLQSTVTRMPAALRVRLLHPTRAGLDRDWSLPLGEPRNYRAAIDDLPAGKRTVVIDDPHGQWRLLGEADLGATGELALHAR